MIKGNTSSKIYHLPDSSSYARTKAGVWFRTEAEAEEAGFRKAGAGRRGGKKAQAPQGSVPKKQPGKPSDG
ncbi:hypothetical protein C3E78_04770 [Aeromicrobium chenweiae]|uniref:Uncharacterized protein n=1 Tax=Aeromicrobium chenweiae TaxID=2079793 RepID=A0A2S0WJZ1_9ACTN|nr:hypothetical protein C3E78_04770 [Aeromicrobium chenweiae]TGN32420.1 hypothetical protein E4L97_06730 [Aeromicrobium chenweiae]